MKKMDFLPWICANYYDQNGSTVFQPYIVKSIENIKIGIIGLSDSSAHVESKYAYRHWRKFLPAIVAELRQKVDCIMLLSSLQENENEEIAELFPSIRLIFSAIAKSGNLAPKEINKALLTQTGDRGRYLGHLVVTNPGLHDWSYRSRDNAGQLKSQKRAIEYRLSRLDLLIQQNGNKPTTLESLERQKVALLSQLENLKLKSSTEIEVAKSTYKHLFMPLSQNISGDREIERLINKIKEETEAFKSGASQ